MESFKRTNYILVDFENTQIVDLSLIIGKPVKVTLVLGEKQKHLPVVLVKQLLAHANQMNIIESTCVGKNALDFILACHLGQLVQQNPTGYFHIVSKDKGYDPLIVHLKQQKVLAARHDEFAKVPILVNQSALATPLKATGLPILNPLPSSTAKKILNEQITLIMQNFIKRNSARPLTRESLLADIHSRFSKSLTQDEVNALVKELESRNFIKINIDNKVSYFTHLFKSAEFSPA